MEYHHLGNFDQLVIVVVSIEEGLLSEYHACKKAEIDLRCNYTLHSFASTCRWFQALACKHAAKAPQVQGIIVVLKIYK